MNYNFNKYVLFKYLFIVHLFCLYLPLQARPFIRPAEVEISSRLTDSILQCLPYESMYDKAIWYSIDHLGDCMNEGWLDIVTPNQFLISLEIKHFRFESKQRFSMAARSVDDVSSLYYSVVGGRISGGLQLIDGNYDFQFVNDSLLLLTRSQWEPGASSFQGPPLKNIPVFEPIPLSEPVNDLPSVHATTSILFLYGFELDSKLSRTEIETKSLNVIDYLRMARDLSGISLNSIDYSLAGTAYLPYKTLGVLTCPDEGPSDLSFLENNDDVSRLRDQYKADLVVFLSPNYGTDFPFFRGVASQESGIAIVSWDFATSTGIFTAVHEIGHLFGGRHEHCIDQGGEDCKYEKGLGRGYGFETVENQWYSIMTTNNKERQLEYSNPRKLHRRFGKAQGRFGLDDMSYQLINNATDIAHRYETFSRRVQGARSIEMTIPRIFTEKSTNARFVTFQLKQKYIDYHLIEKIEWSYSSNGIDFQRLANNEGKLIIEDQQMPTWFLLRLQVWDNLGNSVSNSIIVNNKQQDGQNPLTQNYVSRGNVVGFVQPLGLDKLMISSNHMLDYVRICDVQGRILYEVEDGSESVVYKVSEGHPQLYYIQIYANGQWLTMRSQR